MPTRTTANPKAVLRRKPHGPAPYDVLVVGAGPTGLATAIEAKRAGLQPLVIDKGAICNSLFHYPTNMLFFTTPELMEIGGLPMTTAGEKATRGEALKYYRKTAEHYGLELQLYERVERIVGSDGNFRVATLGEHGDEHHYASRKLVIATGYYDLPNRLEVPGEDSPHVSHYYREAHPYWAQDVVVVGGKNSAAEAALDLWRAGARVTLVHRGAELGRTIKYWVRPDIENRIKAGQIAAYFEAAVTRIDPDVVHVTALDSDHTLRARAVFILTGYHPDFAFLEHAGIDLDPVTRKPRLDPDTLETNVKGMYVAGVVVGGFETGEIFIENGRFHGKQIVDAILHRDNSQMLRG